MTNSANLLPIHKRFDISFDHGKGIYLYDKNGEEYLDCGAGIAVNCLGHCHPKLVEAITKQANKLWHVSNIYYSNELNKYATKLADNCFADYVFFCNSGAEANECAIKMARKHFYELGQPNKNRIITFKGSFHGRTMATISASANEAYLKGFEPSLPGFESVEFNSIEAVKNAIDENTAAILIEPIQGESGIKPADENFLKELRLLCDEHNMLLIFDEVQCGMGRTGQLFAYKHYGVTPDIISSAKAIGGGFPLGACLATKKAASGMTLGTHGTTYGGNPLAMSVASAVLDEILSDGFLNNVKETSELLFTSLEEIKLEFPNIIDEVRGVGLMIGVKINKDYKNTEIVEKLLEEKLLVIPAGDNVIRLLPALIINKDHVSIVKNKLENAFAKL